MRRFFVFIFTLFAIGTLPAQISVSGILDSTVSLTAGWGDSPKCSFGIEEYANLRFQSKLRDRAAVYGAVNLLAAAGEYAHNVALMSASPADFPMDLTAYVYGENYVAGIELERLYFRLNGEHSYFDGGLFRLPFGFGQVWGPMDFLNPKNPLKPDARPRGILGAAVSWFPKDELKLLAFYSAPRKPISQESKGLFTGISLDKHWSRASIQALYSYETPKKRQSEFFNNGAKYGIHRMGLSLKADIEIGLTIDALYTYNNEAHTRTEGLSFSAGADYSFIDGKLIALAEYLYSGDTSSTAYGYGGSFINNNYLYTGFTWIFSDYTNINLALISGLDDVSFTPVITFNHDLFQGAALTITAQFPLDRYLFFAKEDGRGEFGPLPPDELQPLWDPVQGGKRIGRYFNCTTRVRLRF